VIPKPQATKLYASAKQRFLAASLDQLLAESLSNHFGPVLRERLVEEIMRVIEQQLPSADHLRVGQCLWSALAQDCHPSSIRRRCLPIVLTLIDYEDIDLLTKGTKMTHIASRAVARMTREAKQQGALLSMRDIGLLVWRQNATISSYRIAFEKTSGELLPHIGSTHDFGSGISHKVEIINQAICKRIDPSQVARNTRHSQKAVDRYLKDFHRVRAAYHHSHDLDFISHTTALSIHLVKQYVHIIEEIEENET
jgi:hypothetical protein